MKTAQKLIVWALLPLAIVGALVMSASATIDLFTSQGVSDRIAWAAVLMLEVTALAGTLLWVLVARRSLRRDAVLVTVCATGVALVAGVYVYGPVGAVAGVLLVLLTHLASRAWREDWADDPVDGEADLRLTVQDLVDAQPDLEEPAPVRTLTVARDPEDAQLRRARELVGQGAGRPTLRRELGVTDHRARQILAEVRA